MQNSQQKNEVSGIILAAGMGRRITATKQLLSYSGKPMLQHIIEAAKSSNLSKTIVVLGYKAAEIRQAVDLLGVEVVDNRFFETGQGGSIRIGLSIVPDHHGAALFLLGDQPLVSSDLIDRILHYYESNGSPIVVPTFRGKRGNPVLIARPLFNRLCQLRGDSGGRELFAEYSDSIGTLAVDDDAILVDIDTQRDYEQLMTRSAVNTVKQG